MALIRCPECGGKLSDSASTCPHCGKAVDIDEAKVKEISKKNIRKEVRTRIVIIFAVCLVVFGLIIPKVFFHGLLNWENHFSIEVDSNSYQMFWDIIENDGRWMEDVDIHFTHHSDQYGTIKFTIYKDKVYGKTSVTEMDIREMIDEAVGEKGASENEIIDKINTKVEYITWKSAKEKQEYKW